ncbi:endonuclease YncB(thermonuclease family) [Rhizobium sp. BK650]|nr:endonuclease YncB(thermonuclease family) [Rhizobium sp. BK650]
MPWMMLGVAAVGAIAAYDNWKSIRPMLGKAPASIVREAAETKSQPSREAPKQVAIAAPATKPRQTNDPLPPVAIPSPPAPVPTAKIVPASISPVSPSSSESAKAAFGYCGQGEHINCVGDAGIFWYKGEKIVIADMISPDVDRARCEDERKIAFAAKSRLLALLNAGPFDMNAAGKSDDRGAPRVVSRDGRSFGTRLIDEGLARKPGSAGGSWCA